MTEHMAQPLACDVHQSSAEGLHDGQDNSSDTCTQEQFELGSFWRDFGFNCFIRSIWECSLFAGFTRIDRNGNISGILHCEAGVKQPQQTDPPGIG